MLKKILLLFCLAIVLSAISQKRIVQFSGHVTSEDQRFPLKGLRQAEVKVFSSTYKLLSVCKTTDSGDFKMNIELYALDTLLHIEISARMGQPVITIDSICPYVVSKTPKGYFDCYSTINTSDSGSIINVIYRLKPPLNCVFDVSNIYFDKNSSNFQIRNFANPDTMLICIANNSLINKLQVIINVFQNSDEDNPSKVARERAHKIKKILIKKHGLTSDHIQIRYKKQDHSFINESERYYLVTFSISKFD